MCCYFDYIIKIEDFDFGNILLDEKSYENILIYAVLHKTLICPKPLHIMFDKVDGFTRIMMELNILYYLILKNIMSFMEGLDILYV